MDRTGALTGARVAFARPVLSFAENLPLSGASVMPMIRPRHCLCALLALAACGTSSSGPSPEQVTAAQAMITAPGILAHIKALADDSMLGRQPGSLGEDRAIKYISDQFKAIGLATR